MTRWAMFGPAWVGWLTAQCGAAESGDTDGLAWHGELQVAAERRTGITLGGEPGGALAELGTELTLGVATRVSRGLDLFAEGKALLEGRREDRVWDEEGSLERGEMWLRWRPDPGGGTALRIGRLTFEDRRLWWWDEDLDAVQVRHEAEEWSVNLALARESAPRSTLEDDVDPASEDVLRSLAHLAWQYRPDHRLDTFALHQRDRSPTPEAGVTVEDEDEEDAELTWLGLRASGALGDETLGSLAYRLDAAWLRGRVRLLEFERAGPGTFVVADRLRRDVRGWALDLGADWTLPVAGEPALLVGYAVASGDGDPDDGLDRGFRQSGLQENEGDYHYYGELFQPELSNLRVLSAGVAWPVAGSGRVAVLHHRYRQYAAAPSLRDAGIDRDPEGEAKVLGWEWDLAWVQEWGEDLSLLATLALFEAGGAFGDAGGRRAFRGYLELNYEF